MAPWSISKSQFYFCFPNHMLMVHVSFAIYWTFKLRNVNHINYQCYCWIRFIPFLSQSAPTSAPKELTINEVENSTTALQLSWQPPKHANGIITGRSDVFRLQYQYRVCALYAPQNCNCPPEQKICPLSWWRAHFPIRYALSWLIQMVLWHPCWRKGKYSSNEDIVI